MSQELLVTGFCGSDAWDVFLRDEKKVDRCLRADVAEAEAEVVFVNDVR